MFLPGTTFAVMEKYKDGFLRPTNVRYIINVDYQQNDDGSPKINHDGTLKIDKITKTFSGKQRDSILGVTTLEIEKASRLVRTLLNEKVSKERELKENENWNKGRDKKAGEHLLSLSKKYMELIADDKPSQEKGTRYPISFVGISLAQSALDKMNASQMPTDDEFQSFIAVYVNALNLQNGKAYVKSGKTQNGSYVVFEKTPEGDFLKPTSVKYNPHTKMITGVLNVPGTINLTNAINADEVIDYYKKNVESLNGSYENVGYLKLQRIPGEPSEHKKMLSLRVIEPNGEHKIYAVANPNAPEELQKQEHLKLMKMAITDCPKDFSKNQYTNEIFYPERVEDRWAIFHKTGLVVDDGSCKGKEIVSLDHLLHR